MLRRLLILILFAFSTVIYPTQRAYAQDGGTAEYEVQTGDTLYSIAIRFDLSLQDLMDANQLNSESILSTGMRLKIPGLEGMTGLLTAVDVPLGQNLTSLSRFYRLSKADLVALNRLTSPAEIYTGASHILPVSDQVAMSPVGNLSPGESWLELAAQADLNPWLLSAENSIENTQAALPGTVLYDQAEDGVANTGNALFPVISRLELAPLPLVQGSTAVLKMAGSEDISPAGTLNGIALAFHSLGNNEYVALQGIHVMSEPGLTSLSLELTDSEGNRSDYEQIVLLTDGFYPRDEPLTVDPTTIDKANTAPEDKLIFDHIIPVTEPRRWEGVFKVPVDEPVCIRSWYGNRRSYNGSDYVYFHTGLDYGVCANLNSYAPAPGKIVFAESTTVRGNAVLIDHGWGVYSGFWHLSKILVSVGQEVNAGELVGEVGATGRVTGPHLHWEVWVNQVQVNPQEWLDRPIP